MRTTHRIDRSTASLCAMLLVALLVDGCGGSRNGTAEPQSAVETLRRHALAASAADIAPEEAARQLLDFAEATYPALFPGHPQTQSLPPFAYRHYPQTGTYVGVVVTAGVGLEPLGVYVMGGPFGSQPAFVGPLASFITPVAPPTTAAGNGCYALLQRIGETPGTRYVVVSVDNAQPPAHLTYDWRVVGPAVFEGHAVVDHLANTAVGNHPDGIPDNGSSTHVYMRQNGAGSPEITHYGQVDTVVSRQAIPGGGVLMGRSETRLVYDPPWVDNEAALALGESVVRATRVRKSGKTSSEFVGGPIVIPPIVVDIPETFEEDRTTVTFIRRERVTVPAGTFDACVFRHANQYGSGQSWIADGKGFQLKVQSGSTIEVTTSIKLNGQAVTQ